MIISVTLPPDKSGARETVEFEIPDALDSYALTAECRKIADKVNGKVVDLGYFAGGFRA